MTKRDFLIKTASGSEYLILTRQEGNKITVPLLVQLKGGNRRVERGRAPALPQVGQCFWVLLSDGHYFQTSTVTEVREI